jgi:pimeloyl-ACP methyl ester carboxylesterase/DNA-binding CsgD family transcriptional regulator
MQHYQLVRYDPRGHGLSDRNPAKFSLDALVSDLVTVADDLRLDRFAIFAPGVAATTAIAFAAKYPQRVSSVILYQPFPSHSDYFHSSLAPALSMLREDWDLFTTTVAHIRADWNSDRAPDGATLFRQAVDRDFYIREVETATQFDTYSYAGNIGVPTLIIARRKFDEHEMGIARRLAATIPGATLLFVDGQTRGIWDEDLTVLKEVDRFLGIEPPPAPVVLPEYLQSRSLDLSSREVEVLRLVATGRRTMEIAKELGLSINTVARHLSTIYAKIGGHGRANATRYAIKNGIVSAQS